MQIQLQGSGTLLSGFGLFSIQSSSEARQTDGESVTPALTDFEPLPKCPKSGMEERLEKEVCETAEQKQKYAEEGTKRARKAEIIFLSFASVLTA